MGAGAKKNKDIEMKTMDESTEEVIIRGPIKNRSCTDILCFLLLFVFLGGWGGVAYLGLSKGNPMQLVYPSDSQGRICGRDDLKERPSLLFHDLTKCISLTAALGCATPQVCVKECPGEVASLYAYIKSLDLPLPSAIPFDYEKYKEYCVEVEEWPSKDDKDGLQSLLDRRQCPYYVLESTEIMGRCVPDFGILDGDHTNETVVDKNNNTISNEDGDIVEGGVLDAIKYIVEVLNLKSYGEKIMKDIIDSWWMILLFLGGAMFISFIWIVLMRFIAGIMVWLSLFLTIALFGVSTAYSWMKYTALKDVPEAQDSVFSQNPMNGLDSYLQLKDTWLAFFIISIVFLVIILLMVIFLRNRITIAIELISEGSKAVGHIMSSLFFPMVPFVLQLLVFAWFFTVGVYLASSGVPQYEVVGMPKSEETGQCNATNTDTNLVWENGDKCDVDDFNQSKNETETNCEHADCIFVKFGPANLEFYAQWYNIFGLLWGLCFMSALGEMILAGAFGSWYWTLDKPKDLPSMALISSFGRTFRYHLGTLAFGSLVIAIIKFIRLILQYIQDKLEEKGADNPVVKAILCVCKCCFWCLEKFMKFINRNAYIVTAIYGTNFCVSAKEAFSLILRNIARVAVLDKVTDFLLLLGKLVIVGGVTILSFYVFSGGLDHNPFDVKSPKLNYYFVPVILIMIGTYFIAKCFFSVYAMAVDTVFLCFLLDLEKNDGSREKPYYMSVKLKKILDLKEKKEKKAKNKIDRI